MTVIAGFNEVFNFPERKERIKARWAAIYLEPMVGSGERLTVGVGVASDDGYLVVPVPALERMSCVYGNQNEALLFAAQASLESLTNTLMLSGMSGLESWKSPLEGITLGLARHGSGNSLEEIARTAIALSSSLVERAVESEDSIEPKSSFSESRLEKLVKEKVLELRASLEPAFSREFRARANARAMKVNFVGSKLVANFGLLIPHQIPRQVKDAKSKLWDLAQIQEYVSEKQFNLSGGILRYELLMYRVRKEDPQYNDRQVELVDEAINELEFEADKKNIFLRPLYSSDEIAQIIVNAEAA